MSGEAATGLPVHSSTCIIIMTEVHHLDKCLKEVSLTIHNHDKDSRFESILTPPSGGLGWACGGLHSSSPTSNARGVGNDVVEWCECLDTFARRLIQFFSSL